MRRMVALVLLSALLGGCGDGGAGDGDAARFCLRLDRLMANDPFRAFGDTATPAEVETAFAALLERADGLVEVAPADARPAAQDYLEAATALDSLLAGAAYVGADVDVPAYQDEQVAYADAARRLERYLEATC
jgi:hypothetical protein